MQKLTRLPRPHTTAQLVQVSKSQPLWIFNHHDVGMWDVDTDYMTTVVNH
jgi:hypothetical protein